MSRVRARNTLPELTVRSALHGMGFRFRLHSRDLPGKPDIVLPRYHKVIYVHGCFWHQHKGCLKAKRPRTNQDFWNAKLDRNIARDQENYRDLCLRDWECLIVWECQTLDSNDLVERLRSFLTESQPRS